MILFWHPNVEMVLGKWKIREDKKVFWTSSIPSNLLNMAIIDLIRRFAVSHRTPEISGANEKEEK
jgi:hypothetical protein